MRAQDRRTIAAAKRQAAAKRKVVAKFARPALPFTASPDDLPVATFICNECVDQCAAQVREQREKALYQIECGHLANVAVNGT